MLEKLGMSSIEIIVYATLCLIYCLAAWGLAKNGIIESCFIKKDLRVWLAIILALVVFFATGCLEQNGRFKQGNLFLAIVWTFLCTVLSYFMAFFFLPKGMPEYNRACIGANYYARNYFKPGIKRERDNVLAEFNGIKKSLRLFERAIKILEERPRSGAITRVFSLLGKKVNREGKLILNCPNCSGNIEVPLDFRSGKSHCFYCGAELKYKNTNESIHLTAFGPNVRCPVDPSVNNKVALAYAKTALLLRITNRFNEANAALIQARNKISEAILNDPANKSFFETEGFILFLTGELAHVEGDKVRAGDFYRRSLEIDVRLLIYTNLALIEELIDDVS